MIVYGDRKCLLCLILSDDILIKKRLDLPGFHQMDIAFHLKLLFFTQLFLDNLRAHVDAFVADVHVPRPCNQLSDLILRLAAEGAPNFLISFIRHSYLDVTTSSISPYVFASSAVIQ